MKKLTLHDIQQLKGKRQLTEVAPSNLDEAAAADAAGIDMLVTGVNEAKAMRRVAPHVFLIVAVFPFEELFPSNEVAIRHGIAAMEAGGDALYCGCHNMERVAALASCRIPVIGHVGFIPYLTNWIGGPRAIGKTAEEALQVYRHVKAYENASAVGVEMELVPHRVATEISRRTKMCVISMGSGTGCDAQYLFATDMLGTNRGHVPRHAKQYINLQSEYDRLRGLMTDAFKTFKQEVDSCTFPGPRNLVEIPGAEFSKFVVEIKD